MRQEGTGYERECMGMTGSPDTGTGDWSLLGVNDSGAKMELLQVHQSCLRVEEMPA